MANLDLCGSTYEQYAKYVLNGSFGKTSRGHCQAAVGRISDASCPHWMSSGTVWHGEYLTRNSSEYPKDAGVSFLSDILEPNHQQKYSLSAKACEGILRRAEKRGKPLPKELVDALREQAKE